MDGIMNALEKPFRVFFEGTYHPKKKITKILFSKISQIF